MVDPAVGKSSDGDWSMVGRFRASIPVAENHLNELWWTRWRYPNSLGVKLIAVTVLDRRFETVCHAARVVR